MQDFIDLENSEAPAKLAGPSKIPPLNRRWFILACLVYVAALFTPCLHYGVLAPGDQSIGSFSPNLSQQALGVTCMFFGWIGPHQSNSVFEMVSLIGWWANPMMLLAFWLREGKPRAAVSWAAWSVLCCVVSLLSLFVEQFLAPADMVWHLHYGAVLWLASMFLFFMALSANYSEDAAFTVSSS